MLYVELLEIREQRQLEEKARHVIILMLVVIPLHLRVAQQLSALFMLAQGTPSYEKR